MHKLLEYIKDKKDIILSIILSIISNIGFVAYLILQGNKVNGSIICISIIIQAILMNSCIEFLDKKKVIFTSIISLIYSILIILGAQLEMYSDIQWRKLTFIAIIGFTVFIFIIISFIIYKIKELKCNKNYEINLKEKNIKIIIFLTILIIWTIGYIASFPGVYGYDAGFQILEFQDETVNITTHFSILYSFILYLFVFIGKVVFNNYDIGFGIYSFIQMLFIVYVAYKVCWYIYNKFKNKYILIASIGFFILIPYNFILSISSCQDVWFGGIFALIIINLLNMIENEKYYKNLKNLVIYCIQIILLCLTRNNGLYATIVAIPFLLIFFKKKRVIAATVIAIIIAQIAQTIMFKELNVEKGNSLKEMMSIPVQQIGRVYCYNKESLTEEEMEYILKLVPGDVLEIHKLNQSISDALKSKLNTDLIKQDIGKFIKNYIKIGWKNKTEYIEAAMLNNLGLWYPDKVYPDTRMYHPLLEYKMLDAKIYNDKYIQINRKSAIPFIDKVFTYLIADGKFSKIPVIGTISSMGTASFIIIFSIFMILYNKKYRYLTIIGEILGLYLTLLLAPVALYRYMYGIMLIIPIIISLPFASKNKEIGGEENG